MPVTSECIMSYCSCDAQSDGREHEHFWQSLRKPVTTTWLSTRGDKYILHLQVDLYSGEVG